MDSRGGASSDANSTLTEVGSVEDIDDDETKVESVENFQGSTSEESDSGVDMACTAEQNVDFKYSLNDISDNDMLNSEIKICQNKNSIGANLTGQDCSNVEGNETYRIQTDSSVTDSNQSIESEEPYEELRNRIDMIDGTVKQRIFERMIKKHIAYEVVCQEYSPMKVDELVQLMVNTICSPQRYIRINGDNESAEVVKARFLKINDMHIRYVLERLNSNTTKIRNIRNYLLTALYNAPDTMENFYEAEVHYNSGAVVSENIDMNENGVHQEVESRHEVIAELESLFSRE